MSYADKSCYEGSWVKNERKGRHSCGVMLYLSLSGVASTLQHACMFTLEGKCTKRDGTIYRGTYKNDFEYDGTDTLPDSSELKYVKGKKCKKK